MGLACPVCQVPHTDAEHLADHLAITAMVRQGDHRAWLDEHVSTWADMTRADLGSLVGEHAEMVDSVDIPAAEGKHGHRSGHTHGQQHEQQHRQHQHTAGTQPIASDMNTMGDLDADAHAIFEEARKLTEQMQSDGIGDDGDEETDRADEDDN